MSCEQYCANRLEHSSVTRFTVLNGNFSERRYTLLFCVTKREQFGLCKTSEWSFFFHVLDFYGNSEDYVYGTYRVSSPYSVNKEICLCDYVCMHMLKVYWCVHSCIKAVKTLLRQQQSCKIPLVCRRQTYLLRRVVTWQDNNAWFTLELFSAMNVILLMSYLGNSICTA